MKVPAVFRVGAWRHACETILERRRVCPTPFPRPASTRRRSWRPFPRGYRPILESITAQVTGGGVWEEGIWTCGCRTGWPRTSSPASRLTRRLGLAPSAPSARGSHGSREASCVCPIEGLHSLRWAPGRPFLASSGCEAAAQTGPNAVSLMAWANCTS
ncbi:hypothetical protein BS50DRAFT_91694 [Corynespora cassiicola Philippines]|uniref:Uncharacterized protein n=1 Tax=Corynespora cassiicola Philippines TaxID=1448308 RepID=A0A2T2NET2_CORCC|nr:hypothetical protein BS50DRAFT_91694 [Corynespora cassiicola Philippines]